VNCSEQKIKNLLASLTSISHFRVTVVKTLIKPQIFVDN